MWWALALMALVSCGTNEGATITIQVVSDYVAGIEAVSAVTDFYPQSASGTGALSATRIGARFELDTPLAAGTTVATIAGVALGRYELAVALYRGDGSLLSRRPASIEVTGDATVTLHITADCAGVLCPSDATGSSLTACVRGTCVDPTCTAEHPENCDESVLCGDDSECTSVGNACAAGVCTRGVCIATPIEGRCGDGEYCSREGLCEVIESLDGGLNDGGADDAGDAGDDAGVVFDGGEPGLDMGIIVLDDAGIVVLDDASTDAGIIDVDAELDGGIVKLDSGADGATANEDASTDSAVIEDDAGIDAAVTEPDAGIDAAVTEDDAGIDASIDASVDAAVALPDAAIDTSVPDAAVTDPCNDDVVAGSNEELLRYVDCTVLPSLTISGRVTELSLPRLVRVRGDVNVYDAADLESIDLGSLARVDGSFHVTNSDTLRSLEMPSLELVRGKLGIGSNDSLDALAFDSLSEVEGAITIEHNAILARVSLSALDAYGSALHIVGNTADSECGAGNQVDVRCNDSLTSLNLASLETFWSDAEFTENASLKELVLDSLSRARGSFTLTYNSAWTRGDFGALERVDGNFSVGKKQDELSELNVPNLYRVGGSLTLTQNGLSSFSPSGLEYVGKELVIENNRRLEKLGFESLTEVRGAVYISRNMNLGGIGAPRLGTYGSQLAIFNNADREDCSPNAEIFVGCNDGLGTLDLSAIESVRKDVQIVENRRLEYVYMSALERVRGSVEIGANESLTTVDMQALARVDGNFKVGKQRSLSDLSIYNLELVGGEILIRDTSIGGLDLGALEETGSLHLSANDSLGKIDLGALENYSDSFAIYDNGSRNCGEAWTAAFIGCNDSLSSLNLASLESTNDSLEIFQNGKFESLRFDGLREIGGVLNVEENGSLASIGLDALEDAAGLSVQTNAVLEAVSAPLLGGVTSAIVIAWNEGLRSVSLPSVDTHGRKGIRIVGNGGRRECGDESQALLVYCNAGVRDIDLSGLRSVNGTVLVVNNEKTDSVLLTSLASVSKALYITKQKSPIGYVDLSSLVTVGDELRLSEIDALTLGRLARIGSNMFIGDSANISELDLETLETVGGQVYFANLAALGSLSMPSLRSASNILVLYNDALERLEIRGPTTVLEKVIVENNRRLCDFDSSGITAAGISFVRGDGC